MKRLEELFRFVYKDYGVDKTLFLLHGTGADEYDLLPLVAGLEETHNLVGLRGNVVEEGLRRFFARYSMNDFDEDSIREEAGKLAEFVQLWQIERGEQEISWLGYSNGANMIGAFSMLYPKWVKRAVLLHPMMVLEPPEVDLSGAEFLVTYGKQDPLIPEVHSRELIAVLQERGAKVEVAAHEGGHEIVREEVERLERFLRSRRR
jgi:phospholipase/carboxylesterase